MAASDSSIAEVLVSLIGATDGEAREWFAGVRRSAAGGEAPNELARAYTGAARRLGADGVAPTREQERALAESGLHDVASWSRARTGRAWLLLTAAPRLEDAPRFVAGLFRTGDNDERVALLGVLAALEQPQRFVETAQEACRTHVTSVFEAIACRNPYPALYFSEEAFNQMVLKALFIGVALARIDGLDRRTNPELLRMAAAYASERRAAGRPVPDDALQLLALERNAS